MATLRKEEGRALQLAKDALAAAIREDWPQVASKLQDIAEFGPRGLERAMLGFCDTAIARSGVRPGQPMRIRFRRGDGDQRVTDADGVPRPEVAWAGRMLAARAAGDEDAWRALLTSVPDAEFGRHVGALLEMCALVTASAKKGGA